MALGVTQSRHTQAQPKQQHPGCVFSSTQPLSSVNSTATNKSVGVDDGTYSQPASCWLAVAPARGRTAVELTQAHCQQLETNKTHIPTHMTPLLTTQHTTAHYKHFPNRDLHVMLLLVGVCQAGGCDKARLERGKQATPCCSSIDTNTD